MTAELYIYLLVAFFGLVFCILKCNNILYNVITFSLFLSYSFIVRTSGFDFDMKVYAISLKGDELSLYYLKEPLYWFTSRYIYSLSHSEIFTFIFFDSISFIVILYVRSILNLPKFFPYLFLLFFPSVMGMQNVYRQYLSYSFLILLQAFIYNEYKFKKKVIVLFISGLFHNVGFLFVPLVFLSKKNKFKFILISLCVFILLPIALSTKTQSETGELGVWVYLVLMAAILIYYILLNKRSIKGLVLQSIYLMLYLISLSSLSAVLMGSAQSKRVCMGALLCFLIPLVQATDQRYKNSSIFRVLLYIIALSPTFLFSATQVMLSTRLLE